MNLSPSNMKKIRILALACLAFAVAFLTGCESMPSGGSTPSPSGHRH